MSRLLLSLAVLSVAASYAAAGARPLTEAEKQKFKTEQAAKAGVPSGKLVAPAAPGAPGTSSQIIADMAATYKVRIEPVAEGDMQRRCPCDEYVVYRDADRLGTIEFNQLAPKGSFAPDLENSLLLLLGRKSDSAGASSPAVKLMGGAKKMERFKIEEGSSLMTVVSRQLELNASGRIAGITVKIRGGDIIVAVLDDAGKKPFTVTIGESGEPFVENHLR